MDHFAGTDILRGLAAPPSAAAITYVIQALAKQGEHIVAQKAICGGTANLFSHTLPLYGVETSLVDVRDLDAVTAAIRPNTIRLSIGTEHIDDLIADLEKGFAAV